MTEFVLNFNGRNIWTWIYGQIKKINFIYDITLIYLLKETKPKLQKREIKNLTVCNTINFNQLQKDNKYEIEDSNGVVRYIQTVYIFRKLLDSKEPRLSKTWLCITYQGIQGVYIFWL